MREPGWAPELESELEDARLEGAGDGAVADWRTALRSSQSTRGQIQIAVVEES